MTCKSPDGGVRDGQGRGGGKFSPSLTTRREKRIESESESAAKESSHTPTGRRMTGSALARYELCGAFHARAGRAKASEREVQEGDRDGSELGFDHRRIFFLIFAGGV